MQLLQYYMIVESETTLITLYTSENGAFVIHKYTNKQDIVTLEYFGISFSLQDVYGI